jgi:hypothetical protein
LFERLAQLGTVVFAPLAASRKTFLHPALASWRTRAPTLWPSVETRAFKPSDFGSELLIKCTRAEAGRREGAPLPFP